jgi:hypothetical protein
MNGNQKKWLRENGTGLLLILSAAIYLLSFFLLAYSNRLNLSGYECAYIAFGIAFDLDVEIDGGFIVQLLNRGHFLLLGLHNVIVPICLLLYKKIEAGNFRWLVNILFISLLNTILFFFYNYFSEQMDGEALLSGYYVWVFASVLIYVILNWKMKSTAID